MEYINYIHVKCVAICRTNYYKLFFVANLYIVAIFNGDSYLDILH